MTIQEVKNGFPGPSACELHSLAAIEEFERVPVEQRFPMQTSFEVMKEACRRNADKSAIEFLPTGAKDEASFSISYQRLYERLIQTANLLSAAGIQSGDAVSMMLPTLPQTHYILWGTQTLGAINPLNPLLSVEHLVEIMDVIEAKSLVTIAPIAGNSELWDKAVAMAKQVKSLESLVVISMPGVTEDCPESIDANVKVIDYTATLDSYPADELSFSRHIDGATPAAYMHTGGTTGRPKVASLSHGNIAFVAQFFHGLTEDRPAPNMPSMLPMFHIFGLMVNGIGAFAAGKNSVILTPQGFRNPNVIENFWAHLERFRFEGFAGVPTMLSVLSNVPVGDHDISSLKEVLCGAAPLPDPLKLDFEKRFDCWVRNGYGMTETTVVLSYSKEETPVPMGSCGLRVPYSERIVGEVKDGKLVRVCEPNEVGSVLSRGPNIFTGYLEKSDNDKAWADDWFITGDMGYEDENGFLFLVGRSKDLIIRGGHNIDPVLIEEPLLQYPGVSEVVAVGQPDPHAGELPVAFVVKEPGSDVSEQQLLDYAMEKISERPAVPKRIQFITEVPLTAVGKIFKPRLREMTAEYVLGKLFGELGIEAGVAVTTDQKKGLIANVSLDDGSREAELRQALTSYPVVVQVEVQETA